MWDIVYNLKVLECSWDELLKKVREAEDLDNIIEAHQQFLASIITRSLLDTDSSVSHIKLKLCTKSQQLT